MKTWKISIAIALLLGLMIAGCSNAETKQTDFVPSANNSQASQKDTSTKDEPAKPAQVEEKSNDLTQLVELDHLKVSVNQDWTVQKGLDSVGFSYGNDPIGGIDGLGYNESIESLIPNQSEIVDQKELEGLPVKAYKVTTKFDTTTTDKQPDQIHVYLLLKDQKVVYGLHFNSGSIDEDEIVAIAKTAVIK